MKDEFEEVSEGSGPTLEELAQDYGLAALPDMFNQRGEMLTLYSLHGLNVPVIDIVDRNCSIVFNYRDDIELADSFAEGFELVLVDDESGESLVSVFHAMSDSDSGRFDVSGGHINAEIDQENNPGVDPWSVMEALLYAEEPDDGFPVPVVRGPYLH